MQRASSTIVALALIACVGTRDANDARQLGELAGQRIRLHGKAKNAKRGAIIVIADGTPLYLGGVEAWPNALVGHEVTATTGVVIRQKLINDPIGEHGELVQGAWGTQWLLHDATLREGQ